MISQTSTTLSVQPIAEVQEDGSNKYLFEDKEILDKMEKYHITKSGLSDISKDMEQLNTLIKEAKRDVNAPGIMNNFISDA